MVGWPNCEQFSGLLHAGKVVNVDSACKLDVLYSSSLRAAKLVT